MYFDGVWGSIAGVGGLEREEARMDTWLGLCPGSALINLDGER